MGHFIFTFPVNDGYKLLSYSMCSADETGVYFSNLKISPLTGKFPLWEAQDGGFVSSKWLQDLEYNLYNLFKLFKFKGEY